MKQTKELVIIAENDQVLGAALSDFLRLKGYETLAVSTTEEALDLIGRFEPVAVIADVRMPTMGGLELLKRIREDESRSPVLLITGHPEQDAALEAVRNGAFDYIVKPFQLEILYYKLCRALESSRLSRENSALASLASLHDIATKLTTTHDLDELPTIALNSCLRVLKSESGCIRLARGNAESKLEFLPPGKSLMSGDPDGVSKFLHSGAAEWVVHNGRPLMLNGGTCYPEGVVPPEENLETPFQLLAPLSAYNDVLGVVALYRTSGDTPFTVSDLNTLNVLATQIGVAFKNAGMYTSIHRKLDELSLISTYSEQLMGLIEKKDVIKSLFSTIRRYFDIDTLGFLLVRKRFHEFLYWSRAPLSRETLSEVSGEVIDRYNKSGKSKVLAKRVTHRKLLEEDGVDGSIDTPPAFSHIVPIVWEDFNFGVLYCGASRDLDNREEKLSLLSSLISQTRIALANANLYNDMKENYIRTIKALAIAVDAKDTYTHGHSENVMNIAEALAGEFSDDRRWIGIVRDAGLLHDIGKIGIPGYILNKPGPLTYEEFNGIMKTHTTLGANIVRDVPFLRELYSLILYHHENYDGSGYPEGLEGEDIPLGARILHVADAFEAMTSNRPYRNSLGKGEAVRRLRGEQGRQFDPAVVEIFFEVAQAKGWFGEADL